MCRKMENDGITNASAAEESRQAVATAMRRRPVNRSPGVGAIGGNVVVASWPSKAVGIASPMRRAMLPCFLLALAAASPSRAQTELPDHPFRNLVHARSMAMGGGYRALGLGLETVVGNPAAMSLYQHYDLEL